MTPASLLQLHDMDFLRAVVTRYPEVALIAGEAEASPEGNSLLSPNSLAYAVFDSVHPTAIEADRTLLGLLTLKWVLTGDYECFTSVQADAEKLSRASFDELRAYTKSIAATDDDLEFCLYSLACNDLGKTLYLVGKHRQETGSPADDHDQLLAVLVEKFPHLFPAYGERLTASQRQSYLAGLRANFNLGQFVQGENFPCNLDAIQNIDKKSRDLRLVCELFDFAGATGHVNPNGSMLMTDRNYQVFSRAIKELTHEPQTHSYQRYIVYRGQMAGFKADHPEGFALSRLASLSRVFTPEKGRVVYDAWSCLPACQKETLIRELNISGQDGIKGILVYYVPALIANAGKAKKGLLEGLRYALPILAKVYDQARKNVDDRGNGVFTVNVSAYARDIAGAD